MRDFIKTTIIGGVLFLLPLAVILFLLGHALTIVTPVARPIVTAFDFERLGRYADIGAGTLLSILLLVLISFVAGVLARTAVGTRVSSWFENSLSRGLPQYRMVKSMADGFAHIEGSDSMKPSLVFMEDGWQIGYAMEPVGDGWVAVFLPDVPTPMSGTLIYLPTERVRPLDITMAEMAALIKRVGIGSCETLKSANLKPPAGLADVRN